MGKKKDKKRDVSPDPSDPEQCRLATAGNRPSFCKHNVKHSPREHKQALCKLITSFDLARTCLASILFTPAWVHLPAMLGQYTCQATCHEPLHLQHCAVSNGKHRHTTAHHACPDACRKWRDKQIRTAKRAARSELSVSKGEWWGPAPLLAPLSGGVLYNNINNNYNMGLLPC
jgi:hypothetical protein